MESFKTLIQIKMASKGRALLSDEIVEVAETFLEQKRKDVVIGRDHCEYCATRNDVLNQLVRELTEV